MVKVLHEAFGIEQGFMTTVHAYTNDQNLLDGPAQGPAPRPRRPPSTSSPRAPAPRRRSALVLPELAGRLDGVALRVPVVDGSLVDLAVLLDRAGDRATRSTRPSHAAAAGGLAGRS